MKQYLHQSLTNYSQKVDFAIKRTNTYMSLKTENLQFLDIRSYLAPNYSYDAFIKAYKCKLEKIKNYYGTCTSISKYFIKCSRI